MRCLWFWGDFGQPVCLSSGLCSFVAGEFAWYVLPWNLLALVWCLVSVSVWKRLMSSCQLMFLGVRSSLGQGLDLSLLLPVIGLIFTVVSKLLLLYSTVDKTSTLKMKSFSTVRVTQRGSQRYMEKRRGRRELEVTWVFFGRNDAKAETPVLWPPHVKSWLTGKDWCWEELGAGGEGDDRGWDGQMASPTRWTWVWVNSGSWWWTGRPGVLRFMGSQRVGHDWATELNWTDAAQWGQK